MPQGDQVTTAAPPEVGRTVSVDGVDTNYLEAGAGFPLLLLHGSGPGVTAYANWRGVIPAFAEDYRVLAPDLLGFGYTIGNSASPPDADAWVEHLLGFLDAVGAPRVHVIGNSFGGALALRLAAEYPSRVAAMVVMGAVSVPFDLTPGLDAVWGYQPSPAGMREMLKLFVHNQDTITDDLVTSRFEASIREGVQESYGAMFPAPRQRHVDAMCLETGKLRSITQPTLIVHGRDDQVIPVEASIQLHRELVQSELHLFGRCGHWSQIEMRDRFITVVFDFLRKDG